MESKTSWSINSPEEQQAQREFVEAHRHEWTFTHVYFGNNGDWVELPDFTEEVERGAKLMDCIRLNWFMMVDSSLLNLDDKNTCILGQVYSDNPEHIPGYDYEVKAYLVKNGLSPAEHGFSIPDAYLAWANGTSNVHLTISQIWEHLTATWVDAINSRKAARTSLEV